MHVGKGQWLLTTKLLSVTCCSSVNICNGWIFYCSGMNILGLKNKRRLPRKIYCLGCRHERLPCWTFNSPDEVDPPHADRVL
ncbi:hypothetical protein BJ166DRAFT_159722 [Pestalotiopsis sp. NC0098]|nr:hypothetical protein BJ166DRAFT_159722 [Pestalotiopsis sp. NC0098]